MTRLNRLKVNMVVTFAMTKPRLQEKGNHVSARLYD